MVGLVNWNWRLSEGLISEGVSPRWGSREFDMRTQGWPAFVRLGRTTSGRRPGLGCDAPRFRGFSKPHRGPNIGPAGLEILEAQRQIRTLESGGRGTRQLGEPENQRLEHSKV